LMASNSRKHLRQYSAVHGLTFGMQPVHQHCQHPKFSTTLKAQPHHQIKILQWKSGGYLKFNFCYSLDSK